MRVRDFAFYARSLGFRRRTAAVVLGLSLLGTLFEGVGLAMLLPVFQFVQQDGDLAALTAGNPLWGHLVDAFALVGLPVTLATLLGTSFVSILLRQAVTYLRLVAFARAKQDLGYRVRNRGFGLYLAAGASYHERESQGAVVNDLTTELQGAIGTMFGMLMLAGYMVVGLVYLGLMAALSLEMTAATVAVGALAALSLSGLFRRSQEISRAVVRANQDMSGFLLERLRAVRLIRLSGTEEAESRAMRTLTARQRDNLVRIARLLARVEVVIEPLVVGLGFVFLHLGLGVFGLSLEEIGLFLVVVLRLVPILKELLRQRQSVLAAMGSLEAVHRRLGSMREAPDVAGGTRPFVRLDREIRIEGLRFDYGRGDEAPALAGVDLVLPAHRMTALVGPSGAGKSTLVDMLPRLRQPLSGRILFDGTPAEEYDLPSLRGGIAYVPQQAQIFNVTAAEHIRYGKPDASDGEVRKAARLACIDSFVAALPQGYDTPLGEAGVQLSGGQRQRLDLARALVRRAPLLVLDEPTSNLDAESEAGFHEALARIRRETPITIVLIGHRLSTVAAADQVAVMQDGRVVQTGTHESLLARGGWYADAWRTQRGGAPGRLAVL